MEVRRDTRNHTHRSDARSNRAPAPVRFLDAVEAYEPTSSLEKIWSKPGQEPLKLDWNESTVPPSPKVYEAIVRFLSFSNHLNWYPELRSHSVCDAIGEYVRLPGDNVMVTNGSDDALELICKTYLGPRDNVLIPMPTYTHFFVYVKARGAEIVPFYASDPLDADPAALKRALRASKPRLAYLVSPNNPTGVTYDADLMEDLLSEFPETLFIVDEAYHEFYGRSVVGMVNEHPNLVVTRTFSKCFGIAGLRIGYLCAGEGVMAQLKKLYNPKSVNRLAQVAAVAALSDLDYYRAFAEEVRQAKQILKDEMGMRGIDIKLTPANFVLMKVPDPSRFCALLEEEGVYVRDRSNLPKLEGYVRISIPNVAQTRDLISRMDRVLAVMKD